MKRREATETWTTCWCCLARYRADAGEGGMVLPVCPSGCTSATSPEAVLCGLHELTPLPLRRVGLQT